MMVVESANVRMRPAKSDLKFTSKTVLMHAESTRTIHGALVNVNGPLSSNFFFNFFFLFCVIRMHSRHQICQHGFEQWEATTENAMHTRTENTHPHMRTKRNKTELSTIKTGIADRTNAFDLSNLHEARFDCPQLLPLRN